MKILYCVVLFLLASVHAPAQLFSGQCLDPEGFPVEFVSIGINGTTIGTLSDANGRFTLNIPANYEQESVLFSHLSYQMTTYPVSSLRTESNPTDLRITLNPYSFPLKEISVRPSTLRKMNLNSPGTRMPALRVSYDFTGWGHNIGQIFELGRLTWVRELSMNFHTTFDRIIVRVSLYLLEGNASQGYDLIPLMEKPQYLTLSKEHRRNDYTIDLTDHQIETRGLIYIRMELVDKRGEGKVSFPAYSGTSKCFVNLYTGELTEFPVGIGFRLRGTVLKD